MCFAYFFFFFSSRRRHTRLQGDWSSDVCSSDLRAQLRPIRPRTALLLSVAYSSDMRFHSLCPALVSGMRPSSDRERIAPMTSAPAHERFPVHSWDGRLLGNSPAAEAWHP